MRSSQDVNKALSRTIYSFPFPETKRVRRALYEQDLSHLYEESWIKRGNGKSCQEAHPDSFLAVWRQWIAAGLVNLGPLPMMKLVEGGPHPIGGAEPFNFGYVHHGASGAIKDLIVEALLRGNDVHHFAGDYEGFGQTALMLHPSMAERVHVHPRPYQNHAPLEPIMDKHQRETFHKLKDGDLFFVTQPSSINGEYWPHFHLWLAWMERHYPEVQIVLDLTYVGCVVNLERIEVGVFKNVESVIHSLSKPFGMYYDRIGVCVSRREHKTMQAAHTWMHNEFSLMLGESMMSRFTPSAIPNKYRAMAAVMCDELKRDGLLPPATVPANVWMLAHTLSTEGWDVPPEERDRWCRVPPWHRFCMTPSLWTKLKARGDK